MRDPRVDPEPGDVLHADGGQIRTVEAVEVHFGGSVFYRTGNGAKKSVTRSRWRKWAGQEWVVVIQAKVKP